MIQLSFDPADLCTAIQCSDRFRSTDESRPILTSTLLRTRTDGRKRLAQFVSCDSYRMMRISVPVTVLADPKETLRKGVLIRLPWNELRRLNAAARRVSPKLDDVLYTLTITDHIGESTFGLTGTGAWNGRGCFVRPGDLEVPIVAAGARLRDRDNSGKDGEEVTTWPNYDSLTPAPENRRVNISVAALGLNPVYLRDMLDAAHIFGGPHHPVRLTHAVDTVKPILWEVSDPQCRGREFVALSMPVRVS